MKGNTTLFSVSPKYNSPFHKQGIISFFNYFFPSCLASGPLNFCGTPFQMFLSCNDFLKASIIFKGSALHSFGGSQEVWYNGGQNGQRRCPPTEQHTHTHILGVSRGSPEVVLNDMTRVLKRWRLSCFTVWIWNANMFHFADRLPPCECRPRRHCVCLFFFKAPFKNT